MELGLIGLGKMGHDMCLRLLAGDCRVFVFDQKPDTVQSIVCEGGIGSISVIDLVSRLAQPRTVWLMLPAGEPTETTLQTLQGVLSPGDVIIDGGNSCYQDTLRRSVYLAGKGIQLVDAGTSGGIWGYTNGYCLMVGCTAEIFEHLEPFFKLLAAPGGYSRVGEVGAGHFVKMVHNGIEYALMQSYAEGFELMKTKTDLKLDLARVAEVWGHGSVIRSWLLELISSALKKDASLSEVSGWVEDSGEGRWLVKEAVDLGVPVPVISSSLQVRFRSRQEQPFGERLLAALRGQFGGHPVKKAP
jgi:6-phosphogluconate dehydrogenase